MIELSELNAGRFVILRHDHPELHWDLLLEAAPAALTWRLLQEPDVAVPISTVRIADHRLFYLTYEGPVTGERGTVTRIHAGHYTVEQVETDQVRIRLSATSFAAGAVLSHDAERGDQWLFTSSFGQES